MKKIYLLISIIALISLSILVSGCFFEKPTIKCGDGICSLTEDCNTCPQDCGCKDEEYCTPIGVCKNKEVCGDDICSQQEKDTGSCCEDCGCLTGKLCNKINHKCQDSIIISEDIINKTIQDYLLNKNLTGTITKITDSYYKENSVKTISIDCKTSEANYPCEIILFVDKDGNIVDEMRTT